MLYVASGSAAPPPPPRGKILGAYLLLYSIACTINGRRDITDSMVSRLWCHSGQELGALTRPWDRPASNTVGAGAAFPVVKASGPWF
jgi:hypothetical protein